MGQKINALMGIAIHGLIGSMIILIHMMMLVISPFIVVYPIDNIIILYKVPFLSS